MHTCTTLQLHGPWRALGDVDPTGWCGLSSSGPGAQARTRFESLPSRHRTHQVWWFNCSPYPSRWWICQTIWSIARDDNRWRFLSTMILIDGHDADDGTMTIHNCCCLHSLKASHHGAPWLRWSMRPVTGPAVRWCQLVVPIVFFFIACKSGIHSGRTWARLYILSGEIDWFIIYPLSIPQQTSIWCIHESAAMV